MPLHPLETPNAPYATYPLLAPKYLHACQPLNTPLAPPTPLMAQTLPTLLGVSQCPYAICTLSGPEYLNSCQPPIHPDTPTPPDASQCTLTAPTPPGDPQFPLIPPIPLLAPKYLHFLPVPNTPLTLTTPPDAS